MPPKKPPFSPLTATAGKPGKIRPIGKKSPPTTPKIAAQTDKQWQRTKRYGWDSR